MGRKLGERSRREFEVAELVEILNSEEHTSSSSLPTPLPRSKPPNSRQQRTAEIGRDLTTVPPKKDSSSSALSVETQNGLGTDKVGGSWWASNAHSFSPPERDPPGRRRESGASGSEELEVLRSLADSEKLVQQLRAERRARKEARHRARKQKENKRRKQTASKGVFAGERGMQDKVRLPDSFSYESQKVRGLSYSAAVDDPFLQAIALEDSLLGGVNEGKAAGLMNRGYLDVVGSGPSNWQRESGSAEWQSLASLLEQSLAGLTLPAANGGSDLAQAQVDHGAGKKIKEASLVDSFHSLNHAELIGGRSSQHPGSDHRGGRASEVQAAEAGNFGSLKVHLQDTDASGVPDCSKLVALGHSEWELSSSSLFKHRNAGNDSAAASRSVMDSQMASKERVKTAESIFEVRVEDKKTTEDAKRGGGQEMVLGAQQALERERATAAALNSEELLRFHQMVELQDRETAQLQGRMEGLESALEERERAIATLQNQLEQQRAEHAHTVQALRTSFDEEKRALLKQAEKAADVSKAALQSQLTASEAERVEGAARVDEQERLLKEGKKREARLQETHKALLQRDKSQKTENEALVHELEVIHSAAKETAASLESSRREAKAFRARAEELEREKEVERAGAERAREAGARTRRDLADVKAVLRNAEVAQAQCQAEANALKKRLKDAEEDAERERSERMSVQARYSECQTRCQQLEAELNSSRRWGQSEKDRCQAREQAEEPLQNAGHSTLGQSTSSSSDDSVSFLTPSPETSPEQVEVGCSVHREKGRIGRVGASTARSISFAEPLTSSKIDTEKAKLRMEGPDTRKRMPPVAASKQSDEVGDSHLSNASAERAGGFSRSLSSSDSSLEGPPKPWAWTAKPSRADSSSKALLEKQADLRSKVSSQRGHGDLSLGASAEAQSKFHDLKEAYLRVLQTKGLQTS